MFKKALQAAALSGAAPSVPVGRGGGGPVGMVDAPETGGPMRRKRGGQHRMGMTAAKDMDTAMGTGRGGGRGGRGGRGPGKPVQMRSKAEFGFKIVGYGTASKIELGNWLIEQSSMQLEWSDFYFMGGAAYVTFKKINHSRAVQRLNGRMFNGNKIFIKQHRERQVPTGIGSNKFQSAQRDALRQYITSHYDPSSKFLNLDNFTVAPELADHKVNISSVGFMGALFNAIRSVCAEVTTISFSNNSIENLGPFTTMGKILVNLVNVSFQNNQITDFATLKYLNKFGKYREIILDGNPIKTNAPTQQLFRWQVAKRLRSLKLLDQLPIEIPAVELPQISNTFFDSPETETVIKQFLERFMTAYDSNRDIVGCLYADSAVFSMTVVAQRDTKGRPFVQKESLKRYIGESRNLLHVRPIDRKLRLMHIGPQSIVLAIKNLPTTQHSVEGMSIDAYMCAGTAGQIMCVVLHGHFMEVETQIKRSYDRTMLLAPAPEGSKAQLDGWPVIIGNDQLHIRYYSDNTEALGGQNVGGEEAIQTLCRETGMNATYAKMCLIDNAWNYANALGAFQRLKTENKIPPEAFTL